MWPRQFLLSCSRDSLPQTPKPVRPDVFVCLKGEQGGCPCAFDHQARKLELPHVAFFDRAFEQAPGFFVLSVWRQFPVKEATGASLLDPVSAVLRDPFFFARHANVLSAVMALYGL